MDLLDCGVMVSPHSHSPLDESRYDTTIVGATFVMMRALE